MGIRFVISLFLLFALTLAACGAPAAPTMAPASTESIVVIERQAEAPAAQPLPRRDRRASRRLQAGKLRAGLAKPVCRTDDH